MRTRSRPAPAWRDQAASELAARAAGSLPSSLQALVLEDRRLDLVEALRAEGNEVATWSRRQRSGEPGTAWPPEGTFDLVAIRLPKSKDELEMLAYVAASRLATDGRVWIYGANDEGAGSIDARIGGVFDSAHTISSGGRCRLVEARGVACTSRDSMKDWRRETPLVHPSLPERWVSYPGCFAHGRLDEGTRLLIDNLPSVEPAARVLDFGCGTGVVAAAVRAAQPAVSLTLLDNDALALEAARENVPEAEVVLSDGLAELEGGSFRLIISNPPYHDGKAGTNSVIASVCEAAPRWLGRGGRIVMVVQRTSSLRRVLERYFRDVAPRAQSASYRIWEASRLE